MAPLSLSNHNHNHHNKTKKHPIHHHHHHVLSKRRLSSRYDDDSSYCPVVIEQENEYRMVKKNRREFGDMDNSSLTSSSSTSSSSLSFTDYNVMMTTGQDEIMPLYNLAQQSLTQQSQSQDNNILYIFEFPPHWNTKEYVNENHSHTPNHPIKATIPFCHRILDDEISQITTTRDQYNNDYNTPRRRRRGYRYYHSYHKTNSNNNNNNNDPSSTATRTSSQRKRTRQTRPKNRIVPTSSVDQGIEQGARLLLDMLQSSSHLQPQPQPTP